MNYAKGLPRDVGGAAMQEYPAPLKAVTSVFAKEALGVSSLIVLDQNASAIEVGAGGVPVVIRWIATPDAAGNFFASVISSGLGANYDHYIPSNSYRRFVIPKETGGAPVGAVGSVNGLYQRVAIAASGPTGSVLLTQY
jgi:hypothetical protein